MFCPWRICFVQKKVCWTPIFIVFRGCALFGPSCQTRKFWTPTPKKINLTDDWKSQFLHFCFFFLFPLSIFLSFVVFLFLFLLFFFLSFPFFALIEKLIYLPKRAFLFIFECLPLFLLSLFWPPPFSLSPSLSLIFFSFFLLVFIFCFLLVPCICLILFFLICCCFVKRTTSKYSITRFFSAILSHFCWLSLFLFLSNPLPSSLFSWF